MRTRRYKAQVVGWFRVAGKGKWPDGRRSPEEFLFAERNLIARERDPSIEFNRALSSVGRSFRYWFYVRIGAGLYLIQLVDQLVGGLGFCRIAGTML